MPDCATSYYNSDVEFISWHGWQLSHKEAIAWQCKLAERVSFADRKLGKNPHLIAGVDLACGKNGEQATAAVVLLKYPEMNVVKVATARGQLDYPYIPGLLSFREMPLVLDAFSKLEPVPDLVMVDGQGVAHPRRLGLASHLGLFLDLPTIGCAKSRLCGQVVMPGEEIGSSSEIRDGDEIIGNCLRTKKKVKPLYVSVGHQTSLEGACKWVLACCRGYRLPEPTRLAHQAAGGNLKL